MGAFDDTVGAIEIGVLLSIFLFGLTTVQAFVYYRTYPDDNIRLKALVGVVWTLELVHSILTSHSIYVVTVTNYGRPETLNKVPDSFSAAIILAALIGPIIQVFFANRVHGISGRWTITVICWVLLFLRFIGLIGVSAASFTMTSLAQFKAQWEWLLAGSLAISAAVDVLIAVSLCYYLWKRRSSEFSSTTRIIDHLIAWTLKTGLLTSIATVLMLIFFLAMDNLAWTTMFFIISKLFSNSLLASLNARDSFRNKARPSFNLHTSSGSQTSRAPRQIAIEMTKTREILQDTSLEAPTDNDLEQGTRDPFSTKE